VLTAAAQAAAIDTLEAGRFLYCRGSDSH